MPEDTFTHAAAQLPTTFTLSIRTDIEANTIDPDQIQSDKFYTKCP